MLLKHLTWVLWACPRRRATLRCGHEFHDGCVQPWLEERSSLCPMCKRDALPAVQIAHPHVQHRLDEAMDLWREHGGLVAKLLLIGVLGGGLTMGAVSLWIVPVPAESTAMYLVTQFAPLFFMFAICCRLCLGV